MPLSRRIAVFWRALITSQVHLYKKRKFSPRTDLFSPIFGVIVILFRVVYIV
jgi:hypothetical protein